MIEKMRQNMKIIFWVIVICFVGMMVFSWGMRISGTRGERSPRFLGKVNGVEIPYRQFQQSLRQVYQQEKQRSDTEPNIDRLREQTWNDIVQQILLSQVIEREKIGVSNAELIVYMRNNPPQFVRQQKAFQDSSGNFDLTRYHQFLDDPASYNNSNTKQFLLFLEQYVSRSLQLQKLQDRIFATVKVTDPEVREYFIDQNEKVKVSYIFAGPEMFRDSEVKVDQQEIRTYYDQHKEEFREEEKRRCQFVVWEKRPSAADEEAVRIEAETVAAEIREGADFGQLAKELSDDGATASKGGDLGWFGRGQMVEAFEKAAFALKTGQISDPVRTPYGWHIIKLVARKKAAGEEKIRASHILFKVEASQKTIETLRKEAEDFISTAQEEGFQTAAKARDLEVKDTGFFSKDGYIPGIGRAKSLVDFAFKNEPGAISPLYENRTGFWVLQLQEKKEAGIRAFEEVKAAIKRKLEEEQRRERAKQRLEKVASELKEGASLEEAAKSVSLKVKTAGPFSRSDYLPGIGTRNQFISAAFRLRPGETSGIISTDRGYYIIKVLEKQPIDEKDFQAQKDEIRKKLLSQRQYEAYTTWLANLKQRAKIVDNRHYFYGE